MENIDSKVLLERLAAQAARNLNLGILPFWSGPAVDRGDGGFFGRVDLDAQAESGAPKSAVLNARILWTFSRVMSQNPDDQNAALAHRAYGYIKDHFLDRDFGGIFWLVDAHGRPMNTRKQSYAQAFAIYALAQYSQATGSAEALKEALVLFDLLENQARDREKGGYVEALDREWRGMDDVRLSDVDMNEKKSNNTHLHIMEAYTVLAEVSGDSRVKSALGELVQVIMENIYRLEEKRFALFFTEDWESRSPVVSFGHDIEASWLLHKALLAVDDRNIEERWLPEVVAVAEKSLETALDGPLGEKGMNNENDGFGTVDRNKVWWVQAEAAVGFLNAFQLSGDQRYLQAACRIWDFIENHHVDAEHGEWHEFALNDGVANKKGAYLADEWKGPYHNGRACMEILERVGTMTNQEESHDL